MEHNQTQLWLDDGICIHFLKFGNKSKMPVAFNLEFKRRLWLAHLRCWLAIKILYHDELLLIYFQGSKSKHNWSSLKTSKQTSFWLGIEAAGLVSNSWAGSWQTVSSLLSLPLSLYHDILLQRTYNSGVNDINGNSWFRIHKVSWDSNKQHYLLVLFKSYSMQTNTGSSSLYWRHFSLDVIR